MAHFNNEGEVLSLGWMGNGEKVQRQLFLREGRDRAVQISSGKLFHNVGVSKAEILSNCVGYVKDCPRCYIFLSFGLYVMLHNLFINFNTMQLLKVHSKYNEMKQGIIWC